MTNRQTIRVEVEGRVATVTLDDAKRRNAFSLRMVDEVEAAFDRLEGDPEVGAVVITGEPPAFCAGADLGHLEESGEAGLRRIYEGFLRVFRSPLPTVAAVNGATVGAGVNLALACDTRLAAESARFDCRFLELGLHPGGGHTWMMTHLLGSGGTAAMVLFGEVLDGRGAERHGLVWRCVPDFELLATAREMAARAAEAPPELVKRTKQTLQAVPTWARIGKAVEHELAEQYHSAQQPEFQQRLAALKAKIRKRQGD